jgi:hypothetical protein
MEEDRTKYYNLNASNLTGYSVPLRFNKSLNIAFIKDPHKYNVSVIRFVLPNYETPLFTFVDDNLKISLTYKTFSVTYPVIYASRLPAGSPQYVYEIQHLIDMLNTTIDTAFAALNFLSTLPTTDIPYFIYDPVTQLISYIANKTYYDDTVTDPIQIYLNSNLFKMLQGIPIVKTALTDKTFRIVVQDAHNNTYNTNYWQMTQQGNTFENIVDFSNIVITTSMPIQNEYIGTDISFPIMTDFCPSDLNIDTFHNNIVYNAIFPYRQTAMASSEPLYNVAINCYWSDATDKLNEILLPPNGTANIKLMFTPKD